jgi:hypothetical protein
MILKILLCYSIQTLMKCHVLIRVILLPMKLKNNQKILSQIITFYFLIVLQHHRRAYYSYIFLLFAQLDDNDPYFNNLEELGLDIWVQPITDKDVVVEESVTDKSVAEGEEVLNDKIKLYVGLKFRTPDEVYKFYNNYVCHVAI